MPETTERTNVAEAKRLLAKAEKEALDGRSDVADAISRVADRFLTMAMHNLEA